MLTWVVRTLKYSLSSRIKAIRLRWCRITSECQQATKINDIVSGSVKEGNDDIAKNTARSENLHPLHSRVHVHTCQSCRSAGQWSGNPCVFLCKRVITDLDGSQNSWSVDIRDGMSSYVRIIIACSWGVGAQSFQWTNHLKFTLNPSTGGT